MYDKLITRARDVIPRLERGEFEIDPGMISVFHDIISALENVRDRHERVRELLVANNELLERYRAAAAQLSLLTDS